MKLAIAVIIVLLVAFLAMQGRGFGTSPQLDSVKDVVGFSAYVGECIRRHHENASWPTEMPPQGPAYLGVTWMGGESYTMGWCYKRITNGPEDNVWVKYTLLRQEREENHGQDNSNLSPSGGDGGPR